MKPAKVLIKYTISLLLIALNQHISYGQIDAFVDEVNERQGITYYQNAPLTGTLYSNDKNDIPNKCKCTSMAFYKNGKIYGTKKEWYTNGKIKSEGNYQNGQAIGDHIHYDEQGNVNIKTHFENGEEQWTIYLKNGVIQKKDFYKNNAIQKTETYQDDKIVSIENYDNGKIIKQLLYDNGTVKATGEIRKGNKHGVWKYYRKDKIIAIEQEYNNGDLIAEGFYIEGKKSGEWYKYSNDKKIKTIKYYNQGNLVDTKIEKSAYNISNYPLKSNDKVIYYHDKIIDKNIYYILRTNENVNESKKAKDIRNNMRYWMKKRASVAGNLDEIGNKQLTNIFEIGDIKITYNKVLHERVKTENGKEKKYNVVEYQANVKANINVYDMDNNLVDKLSFFGDSTGSIGSMLLLTALNAYPSTPKEALKRLPTHLKIDKFYVKYFPLCVKMENVEKKNSKSIRSIRINGGKNIGITKNSYYKIYDNTTKQFKAKIKITKVQDRYSIGKVKSDGKWLMEYLKSNPEPWLVQITY